MIYSSTFLKSAACISVAVLTIFAVQKARQKKNQRFDTENRTVVRIPLDRLPKLRNDLLLRALKNQPTPRVPVWCMRQAGRHLPEFRELRNEGYDFFTMCRVPELAVEVSLQPLRRYGVDAVIIFCDILVVPEAMGMDIKMVPGKGPVFPDPIRTPEDIAEKLTLEPNLEDTLGYVFDALNLARQRINGQVPLIGFCGGPFTLMTYMIEGGTSRTKSLVKTWLYKHPQASHNLLQAITDICVRFLIAQQQAGAQALQVFESVGAEFLTQDHFYEFAFTYMSQIASRVKDACPDTPLIGFSKGTQYAYDKLSRTKFDCIGMDWQSSPVDVRKQVEGRVSLQGNFDPSALYAEPSMIRTEVKKMLERFGTKGYVANLGHGCAPDMDPVHVDTFIKSVQEISTDMNQSSN